MSSSKMQRKSNTNSIQSPQDQIEFAARNRNHHQQLSPLEFSNPDAQDPVSLGKYSYDVHNKQWMAHPSLNQFPNALKNCYRDYTGDATPGEHPAADLNFVQHDLPLKFKYDYMSDVRKLYPSYVMYLRTTYSVDEKAQQPLILVIKFGNMKVSEVEISNITEVDQTYESKINRQAPTQGDISYSLNKSGGSLTLKTVEIVMCPKKTKPAKLQRKATPEIDQQIELSQMRQPQTTKSTKLKSPREFNSQLSFDVPEHSITQKLLSRDLSSFGVNKKAEEIDDESRLPEIKKIHEKNNLAKRFEKMKKLQKYQDLVEFKIPLNQLYELESACLHTESSSFCAVLLKIQNRTILERHNNKKFLLQIWKEGGQMVFEKSLKQPMCNWNMTSDNFMFQERPNSRHIWLIQLREKQSPSIHQFHLPFELVANKIGTFYSKTDKRLVVPQDDESGVQDLFEQASSDEASQDLTERDEIKVEDEEEDQEVDEPSDDNSEAEEALVDAVDEETEAEQKMRQSKPFSERFCRPFMVRAPDQMIDCIDDIIILAYRHIIYYFDVSEYLIDQSDDDNYAQEWDISRSEIRSVELKPTKKIISLPELNSERSCIVIEDLITREVSFLGFKLIDDVKDVENKKELRIANSDSGKSTNFGKSTTLFESEKSRGGAKDDLGEKRYFSINDIYEENGRKTRKKIHLFGLSIKDPKSFENGTDEEDKEVNAKDKEEDLDEQQAQPKKSPLLKYRQSSMQQEGSSSWDQVGLVLRQDGSVDVYSDFIFATTIFDATRPCVDIEAGRINFFFKMVNERAVKLDTDPDELKKNQIQVKRVKKSQKNRISEYTLQQELILDSWSEVLHERVAPYFKIFTKLINISTFMLVSHQNMISVFNTGDTEDAGGENDEQGTQWVDTVQVDDYTRHIRKMQVVKKHTAITTTRKVIQRQQTVSKVKQKFKSKDKKPKKQKSALIFDKQIISCLVGPNKLVYLEIDQKGKFKRMKKDQPHVWQLDLDRERAYVKNHQFLGDRVLQLVNDKSRKFGTILLLETMPKGQEKQENLNDFVNVHKFDCQLYTFPMLAEEKETSMKLICIDRGNTHELISNKSIKGKNIFKGLLGLDTHLGLRAIRREDFLVKGGRNCQVKLAYPDKNMTIIKALAISANHKTRLFPLVKRKPKHDKQYGAIELIFKKKNTRGYNPDGLQEDPDYTFTRGVQNQGQQMQLNQIGDNENEEEEQEEDSVIEAFYLTSSEYGKDRGCFIRISKDKIRVYNQDRTLRFTFLNLKFQQVIQVQERYFYAASDANYEAVEVEVPKAEKNKFITMKHDEGLFVYNISALLDGDIDPYKVSSQGTGGGATLLQYNSELGRLSFMEDYNTIVVIPVPQLNVINFIGMRNKQQYLIWREKKGFFTAVKSSGKIYTWSIGSGQLLYKSKVTSEHLELNEYEIYQSDPKDITYTTNTYNLEKHSLTLLIRKEPNELSFDVQNFKEENEDQEQENKLHNTQLAQAKIMDNFSGMNFEKVSEIFKDEADCEMKDSALKFSLYHFKVMQLRTHEDDQSIINECRVKFHFKHPLIKQKTVEKAAESVTMIGDTKTEEKKPEENQTNNFEQDMREQSVQRLYLSMNTKLLMEVINDKFALLYERMYVDDENEVDDRNKADKDKQWDEIEDDLEEYDENNFGREIKWYYQYKITRWPSNLTSRTSAPFMFSPNFKFQLDFDKETKAIIILETAKQTTYYRIPTTMINTDWKAAKEGKALEMIFSRMKWVLDRNELKLHIVNQSGIDCIFKLIQDEDPTKRGLELVSVCRIDNLHTDVVKPDSPHFFYEPYVIENKYVTERLIRMNQKYKRTMQHAINQKTYEDDHEGFVEKMVQYVQSINYLQPWSNNESYFAIDMSFTWLDWLIIEEAMRNEKFTFQNVSDQQKLQLAQNVLPNGKGILHMLAGNTRAKVSHINTLAKDLFSFSSDGASEMSLLLVDDAVTLEIPFLNDYDEQTALDICLDVKPPKSQNYNYCPETRKLFCSPLQFLKELRTQQNDDKSKSKKSSSSSKNIMLADVILDGIQHYEALHSSHQIVDSLIQGTRLGLPAVKNYMESRVKLFQPPLLSMSFPKILQKYLKTCKALDDGEYGTIKAQVFGPLNEMTGKIFKSSGAPQPTRFEVLDLPELFDQANRGRDFIEALTECKDQSFFEKKSVQILIDHHYYFWYWINIYSVVFPAFLQVALFWFWNNFVLPIRLRSIQRQHQSSVLDIHEASSEFVHLQVEKINFGDANNYVAWVLFLITFYLFSYDMTVLLHSLWQYNSNDRAPRDSLALISNISLHSLVLVRVFSTSDDKINSTEFWQMQSWVALAIWLRIIVTYLGEIEQFSWLVGLIKYSCESTIAFLTVFLCFITAFADSFNALEQKIFINGDEYRGSNAQLAREERIKDMDFSIVTNFNQWLNIWQIAFRSSIGDFNDDDQLQYFGMFDWIVFFLSCFFLIILMLNLLISVISEAQAGYTLTKTQSTYKERALQIRRKGNSFFWYFYNEEADPNQLLYIVQQASSREQLKELDVDNSMQGQINKIQTKINDIKSSIENMNDNNDEENEDGDDQAGNRTNRTSRSRIQSARSSKKDGRFSNEQASNNP